ncbi:hypothetical protein B0T24DRAFT_721313 [Lasiosphaeria ovina]|uniref:Transmembrane protein n=1 Tax=Lasiosphaeria ovina TaxID=92902 RepID=A0AAE0N5L9_9PEZI|nr:hypothetical protein B0T24DRAFT_721313 [Lasiosphaeria ovina]
MTFNRQGIPGRVSISLWGPAGHEENILYNVSIWNGVQSFYSDLFQYPYGLSPTPPTSESTSSSSQQLPTEYFPTILIGLGFTIVTVNDGHSGLPGLPALMTLSTTSSTVLLGSQGPFAVLTFVYYTNTATATATATATGVSILVSGGNHTATTTGTGIPPFKSIPTGDAHADPPPYPETGGAKTLSTAVKAGIGAGVVVMIVLVVVLLCSMVRRRAKRMAEMAAAAAAGYPAPDPTDQAAGTADGAAKIEVGAVEGEGKAAVEAAG